MNFYRKYRPQTVAEIDTTAIRVALEQILTKGKISQAWLLTGPKGAGKTSTARIIAKILECEKNLLKPQALEEPCNQCGACRAIMNGSYLGVVEMDAASNRGIDDIRQLQERIGLAPAQGKFTVYVIDEVHMLTAEAFNALLKTLEEPPAHVVFILCTTELKKVPETIVSRCTQLNFDKASQIEVKRSLGRVVDGEKLTVEPGVLDLIAAGVDGSFRDAIKLLEQAVDETGTVKLIRVEPLVGQGQLYQVEELIRAIKHKNAKTALVLVAAKEQQGVDLNLLVVKLVENLRSELMAAAIVQKPEPKQIEALTELVERLSSASQEMKWSPLIGLPLQIAIVKWCYLPGETVIEPVKVEPVSQAAPPKLQSKPLQLAEVEGKWSEVLKKVKPLNHSLEALLKAARPVATADSWLTVEVYYTFHKEQLEQERYRAMLESQCSEVMGAPVKLRFKLGQKTAQAVAAAPKEVVNVTGRVKDEDLAQAAEEIFG